MNDRRNFFIEVLVCCVEQDQLMQNSFCLLKECQLSGVELHTLHGRNRILKKKVVCQRTKDISL